MDLVWFVEREYEAAHAQTKRSVAARVEASANGSSSHRDLWDLATTETKTSNPSAIAVVQNVGLDYIVRAVCRFMTNNEGVWEAILDEASNDSVIWPPRLRI